MEVKKKTRVNEDIITALVPAVKRMAIRVKNRIYSTLTVEDLFSTAMVALVEAASKIDDSDREQFSHYLLKRAKGAMYDELRKEDILSRSSRDFLDTYQRALDQLTDMLDREPTHEEIAAHLNMTEEELLEELRKTETMAFYSLDSYFTREDGTGSYDEMVPGDSEIGEEKVGELDIQGVILQSLDKLTFQERLVMSFYYYDELNFKEISLIMNITIGRVSQLHTKAVEKLRATLGSSLKRRVRQEGAGRADNR